VATLGLTARVFPSTSNGQPIFRVRVGPRSSRQSAAAVAAFLSANGFDRPWILNEPGQVVADATEPAPASIQTITPVAQVETTPTPSPLVTQNQDTTQTSMETLEAATFTIDAIADVTISEGAAYTSVTPTITVAPVRNQSFYDEVQYKNTEDTQGVAAADSITSAVQSIAINEATKIREGVVATLNPTFEPVIGNWSVWTSGEITIGEKNSSSVEPKSRSVHVGIDKPLENDKGIVGAALGIGADKIYIAEESTKVESDNYSLSLYGAFPVYNDSILDVLLGYGHLKYDTTRKDAAYDWSHTLIGNRDAHQFYTSLVIRDLNFIGGGGEAGNYNWGIFPYGKVDMSYTKFDEFNESGAFTSLTFKEQHMSNTRLSAGVDMNYTFQINKTTIRPFAQFEYGVGLSNLSGAEMFYTIEKETENHPIYKLQSDGKSNPVWKIGLGLDLYIGDNFSSAFGYELNQFSSPVAGRTVADLSDSVYLDLAWRFD